MGPLGFRLKYSGAISPLISITPTNLRGFFWAGWGHTKIDLWSDIIQVLYMNNFKAPQNLLKTFLCTHGSLTQIADKLLFCLYKQFLDLTIIKISRIFSRPALLIFCGIMPELKEGKLAAKGTIQHLHESIYVLITITEMTFTSFQLQLNIIPLSQ